MSLADSLLLDPCAYHIWIAVRTDGLSGTGTISDPLNGSPQTQFDALMASFPANTIVHLGPGTFITSGYINDENFGWEVKQGMKISGAGIDVTILKILNADAEEGDHCYAIGHDLSNKIDYFELSDLTLDCNLSLSPLEGPPAIRSGAIRIMGNHCRVQRAKAINWGTRTSSDCYVFAVITANPDTDVEETVN
jgi:hypothetical protein